jgi:hypothetical protein
VYYLESDGKIHACRIHSRVRDCICMTKYDQVSDGELNGCRVEMEAVH